MRSDKICKNYFGKTLAEMSDAEVCEHYVTYDKTMNSDCFGAIDVEIYTIFSNELGKRDIDCISEKEYMFIDKEGNEIKAEVNI